MAVTIRDVAKKAGVGVGTVSRVINNNPAVSEATREKVLAAIKSLKFSPNEAARRLSLGKTMTIGVIVPFFTNPSVVERVRGVVSVLADTPYDLVLFDVETAERRDNYLRNARKGGFDGLLIISLSPTDQEIEKFAQANIPAVLIDAYHPQLSHVLVDNFAGGLLATKHLIELGHQKIGYISDYLEDPFNNSPVRDRYRGYLQALAEAGLAFPPDYHQQGPLSRLEARRLTHKLLSLPDPPTAVFAYSDTQAIGVLEAVQERELTVPDDFSVVGFDNIEAAEYLHITTIHQSLFESGAKGSQILLEILENDAAHLQQIELPTKLVVRHTTASPPDPS